MTSGPYKGVRDFYPEDERVKNYIEDAMRRAVESYGYEEMNASVLEYTELYAAKTSEEIVNEQTYTFEDRGGRSVTLRPEMTPTVARMVAARKRELGFPLRWYSIQNFFRYERPQRGRLREFWQLNADLFGVSGMEADAEVIEVAYRVMKELGAKDADFEVRLGSKGVLEKKARSLKLSKEKTKTLRILIDKKDKLEPSEFQKEYAALTGTAFDWSEEAPPDVRNILAALQKRGVQNARFEPTLVRGFDYYTGIVFEIFDTDRKNPRSLFGGGRYDNLVGQYGKENVPAAGFAMGDVIARDFLETHRLLPKLNSSARLYLAPVSANDSEGAAELAETFRARGAHVALGMGHEKISDHIKAAVKLGIPYFAAYGEKEKGSGAVSVKNLSTQEEKTLPMADVPEYIKKR